MSGTVGSFYREEGNEYSIRVRYAPEFRTSVEDLENILVYNPMGQAIRIKDLGTIIETQVPRASNGRTGGYISVRESLRRAMR